MEQLLQNLLNTHDQSVKIKEAPKEISKQDSKTKLCPKHADMPLQYLCHIDKQVICQKCLQHGSHKGHEVTEVAAAKKMIHSKKKVLEQRESEWDREHKEFYSLLEKRKNEKLELVTRLFDELEMVIKKKRHELDNKMDLCYEHEKNRREGVYGEKCQIRQTLRRKVEESKSDFHTDIWTVLNEEVDLKQFELNAELEEQKILEFDNLADTVNGYLKISFEEQYSKLDSLSFPHDELMFFKWPGEEAEVEEKMASLKVVNSHFRMTAENETLKIVLDPELNEDCVMEFEKWKDIQSIEFRFRKLKFDRDDLLTLHYLLSRMNQIQTVKLVQEEEERKENIHHDMEEDKQMEKNESRIIEFITLLLLEQQNLKAIELTLSSNECSSQFLRIFADGVLKETEIKTLKKFSINFKSSDILEDSISSLFEILSICHETLEEVVLDLSHVAVDHLIIDQAFNLPNLKRFALMIDFGKNLNAKQRISKLITSSLPLMMTLEEMSITLFNCNIVTEKFVAQFFKEAEKIKMLNKLSFITKMESHEKAVVSNRKDAINFCGLVSKLSQSINKLSRLSTFHFGYSHEPKSLSSRQEIKSFINESARKWQQFQNSGIY